MSLSAGEMSSHSASGRTSDGSGSHSPNLSSVPHSMHYNPIVSSMACSSRERKRHSSKHDDFSDDDDEFAPASAPVSASAIQASMTISPMMVMTSPQPVCPLHRMKCKS